MNLTLGLRLAGRTIDSGFKFSRASIGAYYDNTGVLRYAGVNVPRYQNGVLLVEAAATNLVSHSTGFVANWTSNGDTGWVDNYGVAPDGTATTTLAKPGGTRFEPNSVAPNTTYCYSVYYRKGAVAQAIIYADGGAPSIPNNYALGTLNLQTGVITLDHTSGAIDCGVEDFGDFFRGWVAFTTNANATTVNTHVYPSGADVESWGAQLELGTSPSTYIPTTGAPATRAADIVG